MTESEGENKLQALSDKYAALKGKLDEFKRFRDDPSLGMQHELPALADVVQLLAEFTIMNIDYEQERFSSHRS